MQSDDQNAEHESIKKDNELLSPHVPPKAGAALHDCYNDDNLDAQTVVSEITFDSNSLFAGPLYPPSSDLDNTTMLADLNEEEEDRDEEASLSSGLGSGQDKKSCTLLKVEKKKLETMVVAQSPSTIGGSAEGKKKDNEDTIMENKILSSTKDGIDKQIGPVPTNLFDEGQEESKDQEAERNHMKKQEAASMEGETPTTNINCSDALVDSGFANTNITNEFLQEVSPLPFPSRNQYLRPPSIPGAHAILGPSRFESSSPEAETMGTSPAMVSSSNNGQPEPIEASRSYADDITRTEDGLSCTHQSSGCESSINAFMFDSQEFQLSEEAHHDQVIEGKILPGTKKTPPAPCISMGKCMILILILLLVVTGFCLIMVFAMNSDSSSSILENTDNGGNPLPPLVLADSGVAQHEPPFQDNLPVALVKGIQEVDSPFHAANAWMLQDPNLDSYSHERQRQRFYLAVVFLGTNGENWIRNDHWMSYNVSECEWFSHSTLPESSKYYVPSVCNENGSMIRFSLAKNNLTGELPLFVSELFLPELLVFDIGDNHIGGHYPTIEGHQNLEGWIVRNNVFQGLMVGTFHYPSIRMIMNGGKGMFMSGGSSNQNGTPGKVQTAYAVIMAPTLEYWERVDHYYHGGLPSEVGLMSNLWHFTFNNQLSGTVPSDIGRLSLLQELELSNNSALTGTLPTDLGRLTALKYLGVAGTAVSGSIPEPLCERAKAALLNIKANCSNVECCA